MGKVYHFYSPLTNLRPETQDKRFLWQFLGSVGIFHVSSRSMKHNFLWKDQRLGALLAYRLIQPNEDKRLFMINKCANICTHIRSSRERRDNLCGFDLRATIFPRRIAVHIFSSLQAGDDGVGANRSNLIPQKLFSHRLEFTCSSWENINLHTDSVKCLGSRKLTWFVSLFMTGKQTAFMGSLAMAFEEDAHRNAHTMSEQEIH